MNEMVIMFSLAVSKFMAKIYLRQLQLAFSACRPFY